MRKASVKRTTKETDVEVTIDLDGTGASSIATGIGFLDHMLDLLARHSRIDITVKAKGDLHIDQHHTTEDVGIALGQAMKQALGDMKGIARYADVHLPMDEALTRVAIDVSGRPFLVFKAKFGRDKVGAFDTELVQEWFQAFAMNAGVTLHVELLYGSNDHHIARSCFKGLARALRAALSLSIRTPRTRCRRPRARSAIDCCVPRLTGRPTGEREPAMSVYTVHEPPLRAGAASDVERFAFVRDGFSWWAFLLAPLWMLWHRMWLVLVGYVVVAAVTAVEVSAADVRCTGHCREPRRHSPDGLLVGFEAGNAASLDRRGWKSLGVVVGSDLETAERRFFAAWIAAKNSPSGAAPVPMPGPASAALRKPAWAARM